MRGIEDNLAALQARGVRPVAISVDTPAESGALRKTAGYTFTFLSDPDAKVIRQYDLLHPGGGEYHKDIARPAELLLDSSGTVRWVNLTEDLRVRATPEQIFNASSTLQ